MDSAKAEQTDILFGVGHTNIVLDAVPLPHGDEAEIRCGLSDSTLAIFICGVYFCGHQVSFVMGTLIINLL